MSMTGQEELARQLGSLQIKRDEPRAPSGLPTWAKVLISAIVVAAAAGGAWYALRDRLEIKTVATTPIALVRAGQEAPLFVSTGTTVAPRTAYVAPRLPGRLARLLVEEGARVTAGQAVAQLETADRDLAVRQAEADVGAAEARLASAEVAARTAQTKRERARTLAQGEAISKSTLEDAGFEADGTRAQIAVAAADVELARTRLAVARQNLGDATLRAPFTGTVLRVLAQPGDFVTTAPGQGVIQLADLSSLEIDAEVSEGNIARIAPGSPAEVHLDAAAGQGLVGRVFAVRPVVDPGKATAVAKLRVETPPGFKPALFPGMSGRVSFVSKLPDSKALSQPPRLEVAAAAVVDTAAGNAVYTFDKNGVVAATLVKVAGTDGDRVVLDSTIPAGTMVVAEPSAVRPGDRIKLQATK